MFQDFSHRSRPELGPPRLDALRKELTRNGLDGFIVPHSDVHQGEFLAARDERLAWLTGFTGSAGSCVVLPDRAAVFVDGRYTLQVKAQVDTAVFTPVPVMTTPIKTWLPEHATPGQVIGYDPWLHVRNDIDDLKKAVADKNITLTPVSNPIDAVWDDQPPPPTGRMVTHPARLAGRTHAEKRAEIAAGLAKAGVAAHVLTLPDSIAWLLNIRGADLPRMPVVQCFAILHDNGKVDLFVAASKLDQEARDHLGTDVTPHDPDGFAQAVGGLSGKIGLDPASAPVALAQILDQAAATGIVWQRDPCILPKACKTDAELAGTRTAHLRDGAAMVEFLAWLDAEAPGGTLTEIDIVRELEARRRAGNALRDIAFETIAGAGPNGAIVHYRVDESTNRMVKPGELLLVDSGGQYLDGTTDVTRTVAIGFVEPEARRAFTLVLKGMIAISRARWPEGLAGRDLDALARIALWQAGMDYDHGTGHGVGTYLGVHEGPQNLSRRGTEPLKPGMILSNEPGYYREGAFGIRIENLVAVTPAAAPEGGDRPMLGFETLTYVPIDTRLVDPELLTAAECDWLNTYHAQVRRHLVHEISGPARDWLDRATAAI